MKNYLLLFLTIFVGITHSNAQQMADFQGKVTDNKNEPLVGVSIVIEGTSNGTTTDENGIYRFKNLPEARYTLVFRYLGFKTTKEEVNLAETRTFNVVLQEDSTMLSEVVVEGKYYKNYTSKDVSGSLRLETPLLEVPQNVQVITSAALADQQITGISDGIVRNVSGATRLEHWADMYANITMRGSRAGAFFNGINTTSQWGPLAEDMSYVDRIEFVKGPVGFLMANGNPSGIYNIVTKKPFFSENPTGSVTLTLGSWNMYRAEADVNTKVSDRLAFRLNLMGQNKKSFRDFEFNDRYIFNPSLSYKISDKTTLTAEFIHQDVKMSEVGSFYVFSKKGYGVYPQNATLTDPALDPTRIREQYANVNLQTQLSDNWQLTSHIAYMKNDQMGSDIWPSEVKDNDLVIRQLHFWKSKNLMKFGQVFLNGKVQTGSISHKILTGLDMGDKNYLADWGQSHTLDTDDKPFNINNPHYGLGNYPRYDSSQTLEEMGSKLAETYTAYYFQDELGFWQDRIRLTLAMRYTDVKQNQYGTMKNAVRFTPRVGLSASILESLSVYALYDQAFLPQSGILRDGGEIQPITGNNMEVGIKKDWFNGRLNSTLSVYRITKNNELTSDPANTAGERFSVVKGQSVAKGIEFDVKGEIFKGMNAIVNYALTDNEITQSNVPSLIVGTKVAGFAKHNFNIWLNYTIQEGSLKGLGAQVGFTYLKDRSSWNWSNDSNINNMGDYRKLDQGIFWGNDKVKITFNIFNALDNYLYTGSYYGYGGYYYYQADAPRNYRLSVSYKF